MGFPGTLGNGRLLSSQEQARAGRPLIARGDLCISTQLFTGNKTEELEARSSRLSRGQAPSTTKEIGWSEWWRRRELNPRPKMLLDRSLHA